MPSRVVEQTTREESPTSESEKSFVSAASENTSDWSNKNKDSFRIGQSAAAALPSPPHTAIAPAHFNSPSIPQASNTNHNLKAGIETLSPSSSTSPCPVAPQSSGSYFAPQPCASGNEARSPHNRRPPASRSSHGIETSSGPPPALSTRRSYNADLPWRNHPPSDPRAIHPPMIHSGSIDSIVRQTHHNTNELTEPNTSEGARSTQPRKSSEVEGTTAMDGPNEVQSGSEEDRDSTLRINGRKNKSGRNTRNESGQQPSQSSQEDIFLNLARADSVVDDGLESSKGSEQRRTRLRGSSLQQSRESRPSSSHRPSTSVGGFGQKVSPMQQNLYEFSFDSSFHRSPEKGSLPSYRYSSAKSRPYAASAHPLDQRYRPSNTRTSFGGLMRDSMAQDRSTELPLGSGRRRSVRESSPGVMELGYKHSSMSYTPNNNHESSYFSGRRDQDGEPDEDPQTPHAEDTESTVSTTAPSTVWDELEDMKSRIRKLEITGKIPASSNAAMSNTFRERPPTATTTMTTDSLSPKRRHMNSVSPEASTVKAPEVGNVHPLLHAALAKTKPAINANMYKALEATASDALALAAMAGSPSAQGVSPSTASIAGTSNGIDRRLRRKADNMCRSLTELCIALSEEFQETEIAAGKIRLGSKDANTAAQRNESTLQDLMTIRATSDEPQYRSSSRVMSRLEARRTSLALGSSPLSRRESPPQAPTPIQAVSPGSGRLDRASSGITRSHASEDQRDTTSSRRPPSRASTEIGQIRPSPQTRTSREFTHPMPNHQQRSPSVQSSLPARKSYFLPASQSPITPNVQLGNRRYHDRSTPPSSAESRLAEARQRRIASLSQHTSVG